MKRSAEAGYLSAWGEVIVGTVEVDVKEIHRGLIAFLDTEVQATASAIDRALEHVARWHKEAVRIGQLARADYELLKEEHETWMEAKRTAARMALEEEKKAGRILKQITIDMVADQVRASWPDEVARKNKELRRFSATVHTLEKLPDTLQIRARALEARKGILLAQVGGR